MKTKYPTSKVTLASASFLAFMGIAAWISIHGPFGASVNAGTAQAQGQASTSVERQARLYARDGGDDYEYDDEEGGRHTITIPSSVASAPVARSRGS